MKKIIGRFVSVVVVGSGAMMLFGLNGSAYIDPSVTTYIIQVVAGLVIAVGAFIGIYFRRAKKKMSEKLGIDENRNKEVETDEIMKNSEDK